MIRKYHGRTLTIGKTIYLMLWNVEGRFYNLFVETTRNGFEAIMSQWSDQTIEGFNKSEPCWIVSNRVPVFRSNK